MNIQSDEQEHQYILQRDDQKHGWFEQYICYIQVKKAQERIHRKTYKVPLDKIKLLGTKVLEVGSGPGLESLILQHDGLFSVATDIDPQIPSKILVPMGIENVARCDTCSLPFKDKTFDIVFSSGLIEHFPDETIKTMLSEQTRVAKYTYCEVPLLEMRILTPHLWDQGEHWYTAEEWIEKITGMGFTIVETTIREWKTMLGMIICSP